MIFNKEVWKKLESEIPSGERITARLAMPDISRKLYVGLDSLKQHHLLIPLEENEEEYNDSESRGLSVVTVNLKIRSLNPKKYIDIVCQDESGNIIFDAIAGDVAEKIDKGIPKDVVSSVIFKWRNFWDKPAKDILSYNELIGMFAEIWFLYYWLIPKVGSLEAVTRWRGPFSSRHDFEWIGRSVEVKATTNVEGKVHRIHGIEQLDSPENGDLLLFSLKIREEQGADSTLPKLIALCKSRMKDDSEALAKFDNVLAIAGYNPIFDYEYSKIKFRMVEESLYNVSDNFPRLVVELFTDGIPSGIGTIDYTINLEGYDSLCIAKSPVEYSDI